MIIKYLLLILTIIIHSTNTENFTSHDLVRNGERLKIPCLVYIEGLLKLKTWAIRMLDASSKLQSGLTEGNALDLGNYDECMAIEDEFENKTIIGKYCGMGLIVTIPKDIIPMKITRDFNMNINISPDDLTEVPLLFSLCMPDTCSPSELQPFVDLIVPALGGINITFNDAMCQTKNTQPKIDDYDKLAIVIFSIVVLLVILSTLYDCVVWKLEREPKYPILIAFSLFTNGRNLIKINNNPDHIKCIDGLRCLSILWVIAGQRYWISGLIPSTNYLNNFEWKTKVYSQYIQSSPLAVDTFLCLSGVVLAYNFIKKNQNSNFKFNIFKYYLHRYLRFTPAAGAMFLLAISLIKFIASGPIWITALSFMKDQCVKYWWSYFLYIQNYVNNDNLCLTPTWYLSVEMQIALISPLFLTQMIYYPKKFKYIIFFMTFIFVLTPFLILYTNEIKMLSEDYYTYYYYATHTRIAPWFIGLLMGFILGQTRKHGIHWVINLPIWIFVLCGMGAIVFTGNDVLNNFENVKNAIYLSLHRSAWSIGVCWIIYACVTGNGGIINWFLSTSFFHIFSRISYSMYVLEFGLVMLQVGRMRSSVYISEYDLFYLFCGDLMIITVVSIIWTLIFVSPVPVIEKIIYKENNNFRD